MMSSLTFFLAAVVSLQIVQDGVHSCTLRNHKEKAACSSPGAADPTFPNLRHTPISCLTPTLGLQPSNALNKISSISPGLFKSSQLIPAPVITSPPVTKPQYLTPVSGISNNDKIFFDLLLEYLATQEPPHRLPLPPLSSSVHHPMPANLPVLLTPTPYPPTPNPQISPVELQQLLSLLLSVSGPGSDLINPAVPSDRLHPPLTPTPAAYITSPPPGVVTVTNTKIEASAATVIESATTVPINVPQSISSSETTPVITEPSTTSATNLNNLSTNAVAQSSDSGSAVIAAVASINSSSDSSIVPQKTSGSTLEPERSPAATVSDTVPAADSVSASASAVESLAPLSQPQSNTTTPSIV
ncbi:pollen-specific leucine-rich repeat extensin-like protein 2 [Melanaphis sacchari]|uniref:pollen-specific leucine-rich repeat extensin-like protein 2 n=1 Tax=Melanaphis sacchari TaxID=742174 RepID=UPI000DC13EDC|nr:pollen-specific leucine-rich repeat extensin-like protein 2 [Melanaphis sacchari]